MSILSIQRMADLRHAAGLEAEALPQFKPDRDAFIARMEAQNQASRKAADIALRYLGDAKKHIEEAESLLHSGHIGTAGAHVKECRLELLKADVVLDGAIAESQKLSTVS